MSFCTTEAADIRKGTEEGGATSPRSVGPHVPCSAGEAVPVQLNIKLHMGILVFLSVTWWITSNTCVSFSLFEGRWPRLLTGCHLALGTALSCLSSALPLEQIGIFVKWDPPHFSTSSLMWFSLPVGWVFNSLAPILPRFQLPRGSLVQALPFFGSLWAVTNHYHHHVWASFITAAGSRYCVCPLLFSAV